MISKSNWKRACPNFTSTFVVFHDQDRFLSVKQPRYDFATKKWPLSIGLPGGKRDLWNEDPITCGFREVQEKERN